MVGIKRKQTPTGPDTSSVTKKKAKKDSTPAKNLKAVRLPQEPLSDLDTEGTDNDGAGAISPSSEDTALLGPSAKESGEAETDSDPIVESDTTEQSGEDDGASWPSDDEEQAAVIETRVNAKAKKAENGGNAAKLNKENGAPEDSNGISTGRNMSRPAKKRRS